MRSTAVVHEPNHARIHICGSSFLPKYLSQKFENSKFKLGQKKTIYERVPAIRPRRTYVAVGQGHMKKAEPWGALLVYLVPDMLTICSTQPHVWNAVPKVSISKLAIYLHVYSFINSHKNSSTYCCTTVPPCAPAELAPLSTAPVLYRSVCLYLPGCTGIATIVVQYMCHIVAHRRDAGGRASRSNHEAASRVGRVFDKKSSKS